MLVDDIEEQDPKELNCNDTSDVPLSVLILVLALLSCQSAIESRPANRDRARCEQRTSFGSLLQRVGVLAIALSYFLS
jgi:hypothetical protein